MAKSRTSTALSGLRTDFQALFEQHSAGLERAEAEVAALKTQLEEKGREAASLKATLVSERSARAAESARFESERHSHQRELREKDVAISEAQERAARMEGEWRERCEKLSQELAGIKADAETARSETESAKQKAGNMEILLRQETAKLKEAAEMIDTLRHELGSALMAKR
jgi:chromosome segregation ATPase